MPRLDETKLPLGLPARAASCHTKDAEWASGPDFSHRRVLLGGRRETFRLLALVASRFAGPKADGSSSDKRARRTFLLSHTQRISHSGLNSLITCRQGPHGAAGS